MYYLYKPHFSLYIMLGLRGWSRGLWKKKKKKHDEEGHMYWRSFDVIKLSGGEMSRIGPGLHFWESGSWCFSTVGGHLEWWGAWHNCFKSRTLRVLSYDRFVVPWHDRMDKGTRQTDGCTNIKWATFAHLPQASSVKTMQYTSSPLSSHSSRVSRCFHS